MLITRLICIQWKFKTLTIEVLLIKVLLIFFDHWSVHLFQSNQRFQAIEFGELLSFFRKTSVALGTVETGNKNRCVAARNAWDHNRFFSVLNGKEKKACRLWLSMLTQARLIREILKSILCLMFNQWSSVNKGVIWQNLGALYTSLEAL